MFYKIISEGQIVDACDGLNTVRWQEKNRLWLTCDMADADGVVSSDGSEIFLLEGAKAHDGMRVATVDEISEEEYLRLRKELDDGEIPEVDDEDEPGVTPAKERLRQLENQVAELMEQNVMLTECLLEMSEIVYGE